MCPRIALIFVAIIICLAFLVQVSFAEHNIEQCPIPLQAKTLMCQRDVKDGGKLWQVIHEVVDCPDSGVNIYPITCILVTNHLGDNGGDAEIISGGIGYTSVEITLTSKLSKGLDYHIEIYNGHV